MQQAVHLMPGAVEAAIAELQCILGKDYVSTELAEREFHAQDVYRSGMVPAAIIRPGSTDELSRALKAIEPSGLPIVPRGGGMSYTDGYLPSRANSIMVDMQRMNRVVTVNADNAYVTVECGATWKDLFDTYNCTECGRCTSGCPANISGDRKSTRLNSSHGGISRMPSSA